MFRHFGLIALMILQVSWIQAAVVYLNTGESLSGKIIQMDDQFISLESEHGFGVLQIDRGDVQLIEFGESAIRLEDKTAIGYLQRSTPTAGVDRVGNYDMGLLSYKSWFSPEESFGVLFGYTEVARRTRIMLRLLHTEIRYTKVTLKESRHQIYLGGSIGMLSVFDRANRVKGSGALQFSTFLGLELFPQSTPNLSVSGEVGFLLQNAGAQVTRSTYALGFPSMSVHYYF